MIEEVMARLQQANEKLVRERNEAVRELSEIRHTLDLYDKLPMGQRLTSESWHPVPNASLRDRVLTLCSSITLAAFQHLRDLPGVATPNWPTAEAARLVMILAKDQATALELAELLTRDEQEDVNAAVPMCVWCGSSRKAGPATAELTEEQMFEHEADCKWARCRATLGHLALPRRPEATR